MSPLLIVEDHEDTRDAVVMVLDEEGFSVAPTENAGQALDYLRGHSVAAVFLDLQLPGMHGLELIDVLRKDPVLKHTPIVVMTGTWAPGIPEGIPILMKPFDLTELVELAHKYCDSPEG